MRPRRKRGSDSKLHRGRAEPVVCHLPPDDRIAWRCLVESARKDLAMSTRNVSNKQIRDIQRVTHLVAALILVLYVYIPLGRSPLLTTILQFSLLPRLAATVTLISHCTHLHKQ